MCWDLKQMSRKLQSNENYSYCIADPKQLLHGKQQTATSSIGTGSIQTLNSVLLNQISQMIPACYSLCILYTSHDASSSTLELLCANIQRRSSKETHWMYSIITKVNQMRKATMRDAGAFKKYIWLFKLKRTSSPNDTINKENI